MQARGSAVVLVTALLAVAGWLMLSARSAEAQSHHITNFSCWATSPDHQVIVNTRTGHGGGVSDCGGGPCTGSCPNTFNYTARLYNDAGSALAELSSSDTVRDASQEWTGWTGCAGAYVRGFIYVNYAGTGSSNTESIANHTLC